MVNENGIVVAARENFVTVKIKRGSACGKCNVCKFGTADDTIEVEASNECGAECGDRVAVEMRPQVFLHAALLLYGMPLAAFLAGAAAGYYLGGLFGLTESRAVAGMLCGVVLTVISFLVIKKSEPRREKGSYAPAAVKILSDV
ncbi:MAG: SoxR reducing system RseC family protein [Defluviitaleaceae bacterium]|nr:SoxR reducing system RseC family protein [Defluviitaleaceae bacterium]